jgi:glycosyltransferase involved in cell wall biosynthesis
MKAELVGEPGVEVHDFADQRTLMELAGRSGAFVLPSRHEPWGVVVHEFAAAGLPLLLSDAVGAGDLFLIHGYNGLRSPAGSAEGLAAAMARLSGMTAGALVTMGERSVQLSRRVTPELCAASLVSCLQGAG